MLYYLDTMIVIYAAEGNPADQQRALDHLAALEGAGHRFAISELTRTECLVPVLGPGGDQRLSDFFRFFHSPNLRTLMFEGIEIHSCVMPEPRRTQRA